MIFIINNTENKINKMGKWTKKTEEELEIAKANNDYTDGYEFFPWLWYMRKGYLIGFFGCPIMGWVGGISSFKPSNSNPMWLSLAIIGVFGIFAPILIGYLLRRDYKEGKKGITR